MFDLVIHNGLIIDGKLTPRYYGNIGIVGNRIVKISKTLLAGREVIDATGLIVSPGFVDLHSHGDFLPLLEKEFKHSRIKQGITTEIVGQCGISPIPFNKGTMAEYRLYTQPILGDFGQNWEFNDLNGLTKLTKGRMSHNMGYLIGLSALRSYVSGLEYRSLNPREIDEISKIYEEELLQGAFGLSLGLSYLPGVFASRDELVALAKVTKKYDGIIMAHIRSHGLDMTKAMMEFIELGRETGAKIHISHCRSYKNKQFGITASKILELVKEARKKGVPLTLDQHPYTTGSTFLNQLLPPEDRDLKKYEDKDYSTSVEGEMGDVNYTVDGWDNMSLMVGFDNIYLPTYGYSIGELAKSDGSSNFSKLIEVLKKENGKIAMVVREMFDLEEIGILLGDEQTYIGSDGLPSGRPHPRLFGAFPKVISDYVRDRRDLSLESAISKMTGAHIMGIENRGKLEIGAIADIVVFDYETIDHYESYAGINIPPTGIAKVVLDGKIAYENGVVKGDFGKFLRRDEGND
ncbi:MAG: N-acyl-D-amino-acid deacylase [Fusobacteria bacterium]|nr:MAG: N-acyl-D-amino-acid deacylase [Fusobacteriota bacterium]KAF0228481.1 MAG: N-acyl-D-amino-acid [Fusobacteriota bacterium]